MDTSSPSKGQRLDPERLEIRLLTLKAGPYAAKLSCLLSVASLHGPPHYNALSYVWGSTHESQPIEVDGIAVPVTQNLDVALRHLRDPTEDKCLWIDALCINQKDVEERNSQVRLMGDIYRSANQVLLWLGEADGTSDMAFDLMPTVDIDFVESEEASEVWSFYLTAIQRPYMSRVWVIQEFVLANKDPIVLCGDKQVLWSVFMSAYKTLSLEFFTKIDLVQLQDSEGRAPEVLAKLKYDLFDELRIAVNKEGGADLRQLLVMSRTSESSEPRDRIYGLLQMLDEEDKMHFDVDYNKPTAVVFAEAVALIFKHGDGPRFLAGMWCPSKPNPLIPDLPSWVPDFTSQTADKAGSYHPSSISFHPPFPRSASGVGSDADNGKVLDDLKTLRVEALPVDTIEDVYLFGETLDECTAQLNEVEKRANTAGSRSIEHVDEKLRPHFEKFRSSEPLWRTLISDKQRGSGYNIAPDSYKAMYLQLKSQSSNIRDDTSSLDSEYRSALQSHLPNRTFFTTRLGLVGLGMPTVRKGDQVTIWFGANVPFITRPCQGDGAGKCELIGAAYVGGIMEGQMVDELYCEDLMDSQTLLVI